MVAAAPIIGLALTAGSAAMQASAAANSNREAANATKNWLSYQKQHQRAQAMKDEANRKKAEAARGDTLNKITDVQNTVGNETQRLTDDLNTDNTMEAAPEATVNDALMSGQGKNPNMREYAAKKLFGAAQEARNSTAALAAMQAYTGSQHGLNNTTMQALNEGSQNIDLYNKFRQGDLATYQLAKGIQPLAPQQQSGGIGPALAQLGGTLAGGGGEGLASMFKF